MGVTEAIGTIATRADDARTEAAARWEAAVPAGGSFDECCRRFATAGRLTLNFHPDRIARDGRTVAAGLVATGAYLSQWITGISAGSRSATRGGERYRFEHEYFGGAYDDTDPAAGDHPVYGAWDLLFDEHGGSPRFGSSFVVVRPHVRERTTLCLGDSHAGPRDVGTFARSSGLLAGLAEQAAAGDLLGRELGVDALIAVLAGRFRPRGAGRQLDAYVEAQIHGGVSLADDVETIVLDPSYRDTNIAQDVTAAADRFGFAVRWHRGSVLRVDEVPDDFRGRTMPALARAVADAHGTVHARAIGLAAARHAFEEPTRSGDAPESPLQQLKYLWHTVIAHGRDAVAQDPADPGRRS